MTDLRECLLRDCKYCKDETWSQPYYSEGAGGTWWHKNAAGDITMPCQKLWMSKLVPVLAAASPGTQGVSERYRPDPLALYRCPYCNLDGRLTDPGMCVDSYMNVCHVRCLPPAAALYPSGQASEKEKL